MIKRPLVAPLSESTYTFKWLNIFSTLQVKPCEVCIYAILAIWFNNNYKSKCKICKYNMIV